MPSRGLGYMTGLILLGVASLQISCGKTLDSLSTHTTDRNPQGQRNGEADASEEIATKQESIGQISSSKTYHGKLSTGSTPELLNGTGKISREDLPTISKPEGKNAGDSCSKYASSYPLDFDQTFPKAKSAWIAAKKRTNFRTHLKSFNTDAPVVWSQGALMESLLELFKLSGDLTFVEELLYHGDYLLAHTDQATKKRDQYRRTIVPAWGTTGYSSKRTTYVVHTGVILRPLLELARLITQNPWLNCKYGSRVKPVIAFAKQAAAFAVKEDWRQHGPGRGYLILPHSFSGDDWAGKPLPYNMMMGLGQVFVELHRIDKSLGYEKYVREMIAYWEHYFKIEDNDSLTWRYRPGGRMEDASHAGLVGTFLLQAYRAGLGPARQRLSQLTRTFTRNLLQKDGQLISHIDGTGKKGVRWNQSCSTWTEFSPYNHRIYDACKALSKDYGTFLGDIRLMKWRNSR